MKIYSITKKQIQITLGILILCVIGLIAVLYKPMTTAVSIEKNASISLNLMDKIAEIEKEEEKIVFLTFDDGPTQGATPKILDILKEEDVKATFFVIGKYVDRHPEIVKRAYEEGHYIANHGYDHNNKILYQSEESFKNEVNKTDEAIGKAIGIDNYCSHIFRFPNGFMAPSYKSQKKVALKLLNDMNYRYVDWNCLNNDSVKKYSKQQLINNLKKTSKNKNMLVVLMHDTKDVSDSSSALKESIEYLKSEGYIFKNFYDVLDNN